MASRSDLDATISALQAGVKALSLPAAVTTIDRWIPVLESADFAPIAATLTRLRGELTSGQLVGARIGPLLAELGTETERAASTAAPHMAGKLQQLASLLKHAGGSLMWFGVLPREELRLPPVPVTE